MNKEMLAGVERGIKYAINPIDIIADKDLNPRLDYGSPEDWESFKNSIKDYGVQQNIKVYYDEPTKTYHLVHGFRRMEAVKQILADDPTLEILQLVNVDIVEKNDENALIGHFILNSGKPLNDVEMGDALLKFKKLTHENNIAEIARRIGLPYAKVNTLLGFAEKAGVKVKKAVISGEMSFSDAKTLVKKNKGIKDQAIVMEAAKQQALESGSKKIKIVDEEKVNFETRIGNLIAFLMEDEDVDVEAVNMFKAVIKALKDKVPNEDIVPIFNLQKETV